MTKVGGVKVTDDSLAFSSKKVLLFEPPLNSQNAINKSSAQWHSQRRASVIGFLDGHSDLIVTNYTTLATTDAEKTLRVYY